MPLPASAARARHRPADLPVFRRVPATALGGGGNLFTARGPAPGHGDPRICCRAESRVGRAGSPSTGTVRRRRPEAARPKLRAGCRARRRSVEPFPLSVAIVVSASLHLLPHSSNWHAAAVFACSSPLAASFSSPYSRTVSSIRKRGFPSGPAYCRSRLLSTSDAIPSKTSMRRSPRA